jgi:hypothetical protein
MELLNQNLLTRLYLSPCISEQVKDLKTGVLEALGDLGAP